jgi:signal transduction histidine kinase/ActR/RegA family two-component response regulator
MDGFETAGFIRQRRRSRRTPIIFMTAYDRDDRDVREAYALGAVDILFKPIVPEIMRAKVQAFVDLDRRNREVAEQAALLREHERREHRRALEEERQRWAQEALQRRVKEQQQSNRELRRQAEELANIVAERERVERELTRTNARLAELDRRKDAFLAALSHELRNPLASIVASQETLSSFIPEDQRARASFTRAREVTSRQLSHLVRLVDDLLDVARIESDAIQLRKEPADLRDVLNRALSMVQPGEVKNQHSMSVRLPDDPIWLHADVVRMTQVVANLLANAIRYTPPGGCVELVAVARGQEAIIEVTDDGLGISPELLPDVFDMFVRKPNGGGLGLGLSLAKRLVEMHGGTIAVRSEGEGKGSRFTIRLPLVNDYAMDPKIQQNALDSDELGLLTLHTPPLRIVLVEDDADVSIAVRDLLESWGHRVEVAYNGRQGIELIERLTPDVALVDIGLPDMDGCSIGSELLEMPSRPRLVAMTGYGRPEDRRRIAEAGFDQVLVKPADAAQLAGALRAANTSDPKARGASAPVLN